MKSRTLGQIVFAAVILGVVLFFSLKTKAGTILILPTSRPNIVQYLESRYRRLNIPFTKIQVIEESPLQIEVDIQSLSDGKNWTPTDFENLYLARREAILAFDKGYPIERYTEALINQHGDSISWARFKLHGEISYTKVSPSILTDISTESYVNKEISKLNKGRTIVASHEVSSSDGFQTLKIHFITESLDEANKSLPDIRGSLHPFAENINSQGAEIVILQAEVKDKEGQLLLNYLYDLQFNTDGWWAADGINTEGWHPSPRSSTP